jgi:hypothetical protein
MQWILVLTLAFDLATIKSEPNLEKRSDLALTYANTALDSARAAYIKGDLDRTETNLNEVLDSVDLAYQALSDTGKEPRKDRFFKQAELRTRALLRRLEGLGQTMSAADRGIVEKVRDEVSEIHDNLLTGIMSKRKK